MNHTIRRREITVDGNLDDWQGIERIETAANPDNPFDAADLDASFMMAWNGDDRWFVAFTVRDNKLCRTTPFSSFADDPNGSKGISKYYLNDCIGRPFHSRGCR